MIIAKAQSRAFSGDWKSGGEGSERTSKSEVSRQLVYMLGGQSESDTCRSSELQRTDCCGIKWSPTSSTMAWHH